MSASSDLPPVVHFQQAAALIQHSFLVARADLQLLQRCVSQLQPAALHVLCAQKTCRHTASYQAAGSQKPCTERPAELNLSHERRRLRQLGELPAIRIERAGQRSPGKRSPTASTSQSPFANADHTV